MRRRRLDQRPATAQTSRADGGEALFSTDSVRAKRPSEGQRTNDFAMVLGAGQTVRHLLSEPGRSFYCLRAQAGR